MSEFPSIELLREARAWWDDALEDATYIPEYIPEYDDAVSDALDWLVSVLDEGGRLVVEAPCEHGVFHDSCDQLVCGHERCGDGWYIDARVECWCPGGSRRVVWPTDKEEGSVENKVSAEAQRDLYACPPSCECEGGEGVSETAKRESRTVLWCVTHECPQDYEGDCQRSVMEGSWGYACEWRQFELHPVGTRVAGPDDLLIRRGVVESWLRMANNGETFDLEYHLEQVLAAAEGEE